jgi:NADPH-dependent 2,4-dienoyl-CoA reductase/sulfur reductase-like enzyme/rhodanese-related sulfurtransferase
MLKTSKGSPKRLLIIGGVAGGATAAAHARRLSEYAEIIVFERGPYVSFANCGLPYYVGGEIHDRQDLLLQTPENLKARFNLDVRIRSEVTAIDREKHQVEILDLDSNKTYQLPYDDLILSTGTVPIKPPIPGIEREGHFSVRGIPDVERITNWIEKTQARRAVVVGGGFIGLEMVEQLHQRGLEVAIVEALPQVMAPFDEEMAEWLHQELGSHNVNLHLSDPVDRFDAPRESEKATASVVVLKSGVRLPADLVILALGVRPEITLAKAARLDIGERGGIRVNEQLQTSDPNIWAIGDAIEVRDCVTGNWTWVPLAGPANRQGRIVAENVLGTPLKYPCTLGTAIVRLFDLTAACTGASEKQLLKTGISHEVVHLHPASHAEYYPGAHRMAMKILFNPDGGKLLGAQIIGSEGVDKRIDVLATAIKAGMSVHELEELELAYAPPFGSAKDPINLAGMVAQHITQGEMRNAQWHENLQSNSDNMIFLDVRDTEEREKNGFIPGSVHIPLAELRTRLSDLPKDNEIIVYCETGQRSYFASRFLMQKGFQVRNLSGGYRTWKIAREARENTRRNPE